MRKAASGRRGIREAPLYIEPNGDSCDAESAAVPSEIPWTAVPLGLYNIIREVSMPSRNFSNELRLP